MSSSGLAQVGVGTPAPAALGDTITNPSTVDVAALQLAYNGATWERFRLPVVVKSGTTQAAGNTTVWTPAAGKKFRLMRYQLQLTGNVAIAVAAVVNLQLVDNGAGIGIVHDLLLPAAAANTPGVIWQSDWIDLGQGLLSSAANNPLQLNLSAALTSGDVRVIVAGIEE